MATLRAVVVSLLAGLALVLLAPAGAPGQGLAPYEAPVVAAAANGEASQLRFTAKPTARRLPEGRWSGTLAAQRSPDGDRVAAQALDFDVLGGGRFMRTRALRLQFLVRCPPDAATAPATSLAVFARRTPFGAVGGRRAIPPQRPFTLVAEPHAEGVALRLQIAVDGDHRAGLGGRRARQPASSCGSERIACGPRGAGSAWRPPVRLREEPGPVLLPSRTWAAPLPARFLLRVR